MLLRSSSTPLLRSLLPPDHLHHHHDAVGKHSPSPSHSPFAFRCNNKPLSFSDHHRAAPTGFRRTHSEGNLITLSHASDVIDVHEDPFSFDSFNFKPSNKLSHRPNRSVLETIPSFSFYGSRARTEEEDDEDDDQHADPEEDEVALENFGVHNRMDAAIVTPGVRAMEQAWTRMNSGDGIGFVGDLQKEMHLARGPGGGGGGGGGGGRRRSGGGGGGEQHGMEEYYKKMVVENPGNALVLSNYAEFLYQARSKLV
ncbi:hypothetical protein SDJN03_26719, partial [Cucurbita argyrosperma subsp. sororia]